MKTDVVFMRLYIASTRLTDWFERMFGDPMRLYVCFTIRYSKCLFVLRKAENKTGCMYIRLCHSPKLWLHYSGFPLGEQKNIQMQFITIYKVIFTAA